jgi:hypothetical protein
MSTRDETRRLVWAIWGAIAVQIAGRLLDARWHATHDEFEGTSQQLEAHWLAWLGVLIGLIVAARALSSLRTPELRRGLSLLLASSLAYVGVAVWHFVEHANRSDPELAHVLLVIASLGMLSGAILSTVDWRRAAPAR